MRIAARSARPDLLRKESAMLWSTEQLSSLEPLAQDGEIGKVQDLYFDDQHWVVRHVVVRAGGWFNGRDVLISPHAVTGIDPERRHLMVALTRQQMKDSPGVEADKPVSRQLETRTYDFYGYPYYWVGGGLWGAAALPLGGVPAAVPPPRETGLPDVAPPDEAADPHLRSSTDVTGYAVEASDGAIGHIEDLLVDERSWQIHNLVIDTRNWLPGRKVLVLPNSIEAIDWNTRQVRLRLTRAAIESSPPYEPDQVLGDDDIKRVQLHYESWL
jgi:sporulation protein YlmC with PRC-barrel domain